MEVKADKNINQNSDYYTKKRQPEPFSGDIRPGDEKKYKGKEWKDKIIEEIAGKQTAHYLSCHFPAVEIEYSRCYDKGKKGYPANPECKHKIIKIKGNLFDDVLVQTTLFEINRAIKGIILLWTTQRRQTCIFCHNVIRMTTYPNMAPEYMMRYPGTGKPEALS